MIGFAWVWKETTFDSAHHLPDYRGACARVHGHTYKVQVGLRGPINVVTGMVVDLKELGQAIDRTVVAWDHRDLNEFFVNPTAELMARELVVQMKYAYPEHDVCVRLWETPTSWVEISS